ncbi:MAG: hypothetical protein RIS29_2957 [Bacteroidota bacterium]|jgi:hypothetical protein
MLFIVLIAFYSCEGPSKHNMSTPNDANKIENRNNSKHKFRKYNFSITINKEHSENDFCYQINVRSLMKDGNLIMYDDNIMQYSTLRLKRTMKYGAHEFWENVPVKTSQYLLNKSQLDSIYLLTSRLFQADSLNLSCDSVNKGEIYDGYVTTITLLDYYNAEYTVKLGGFSNKKLLRNYKNLLVYLESSKKNQVNRPGKIIKPKQ